MCGLFFLITFIVIVILGLTSPVVMQQETFGGSTNAVQSGK